MKNDYINEQIGDEEKRKIMIRNVKLMKCKNKCDGSVCSSFLNSTLEHHFGRE